MRAIYKIPLIALLTIAQSCNFSLPHKKAVERAEVQYKQMIESMDGELQYPRSVRPDSSINIIEERYDWTIGYFPASLWYLYELTRDTKWRDEAERFTLNLEYLKRFKGRHDVGIMVFCPFGNGYRFDNRDEWSSIIVESARSLSTRFVPAVGAIQSWGAVNGANKQGMSRVIIDNIMNLELLFEASLLSGDRTFYDIAVSHADVTMQNHFRDNYSSYNLVQFDPINGEVIGKRTVQGLGKESSWSRGQSWALYGYTMCYRYTEDVRYLKQAVGIANMLLNHPAMPEDAIPYWDYDLKRLNGEPRDASAAAIMASALYELAQYSGNNNYAKHSDKIIRTLSSSDYLASAGSNNNFILKHSTGHRLNKTKGEVDTAINYADYYYLESLYRQERYNRGEQVVKLMNNERRNAQKYSHAVINH